MFVLVSYKCFVWVSGYKDKDSLPYPKRNMLFSQKEKDRLIYLCLIFTSCYPLWLYRRILCRAVSCFQFISVPYTYHLSS